MQRMKVICKHCGKQLNRFKLRGISLICPLCGKPQNGQLHVKYKTTNGGEPMAAKRKAKKSAVGKKPTKKR